MKAAFGLRLAAGFFALAAGFFAAAFFNVFFAAGFLAAGFFAAFLPFLAAIDESSNLGGDVVEFYLALRRDSERMQRRPHVVNRFHSAAAHSSLLSRTRTTLPCLEECAAHAMYHSPKAAFSTLKPSCP